MEWIKQGDKNTRLFFAKAEQRKLASYIYTIQDATGTLAEGFDKVGQIVFNFYKNLLGKQQNSRKAINMAIINQGPVLTLEQQILMCKNFTNTEIKTLRKRLLPSTFNFANNHTYKCRNSSYPHLGLSLIHI